MTRLDEALAILNGAVGDHLARTNNELSTPMSLFEGGSPVTAAARIAGGSPAVTARAVVLVHGLMSTESMWRWGDGSDYGSRLAADAGFTPFYVRYNTGLPIPDNGAALARLLDDLADAYAARGLPLEEIVLIGHSMGGLVVRSACHEAAAGKHRFASLVRRCVYVGTPHLGAPYERAGRIVSALLRSVPDPVTELIADIADLRSAGLKDLGDADLRHEDRSSRSHQLRLSSWQHPVALLPGIEHYLVAGALTASPLLTALFGDAVVPVKSALAAAQPDRADGLRADHVCLLPGLSHVALAHDARVYEQIRAWLAVAG